MTTQTSPVAASVCCAFHWLSWLVHYWLLALLWPSTNSTLLSTALTRGNVLCWFWYIWLSDWVGIIDWFILIHWLILIAWLLGIHVVQTIVITRHVPTEVCATWQCLAGMCVHVHAATLASTAHRVSCMVILTAMVNFYLLLTFLSILCPMCALCSGERLWQSAMCHRLVYACSQHIYMPVLVWTHRQQLCHK